MAAGHTTRRRMLAGLGAASALVLAGASQGRSGAGAALPAPPEIGAGRRRDVVLVAAERQGSPLGPGGPRLPLWTFGETPIPVLRLRLGDALHARVENRLREHTSAHWHGVRVPNDQDGVQYLTQPPIEPGQAYDYAFTPPDPGTFFFHPHCNEAGQVGRGLAGVLVVAGDEAEPSDGDIVLVSKDWRIGADGGWLPFETPEGASRSGTYGTRRSVNCQAAFACAVPAVANVRLRIVNLDSTRVLDLGVEGGEAAVIATDGNPVEPFPLESWRLGPAMRVDLLVRTPRAGQELRLIDYSASELYTLATLTSAGERRRHGPFVPAPLYASRIPAPDLAAAERLSFSFSATSGAPAAVLDGLASDDPLAKVLLDSLCTGERSFWAINKTSWPAGGHRALPPPLATLKAGRSYVAELVNRTPHIHPIHLHGHSFDVLSASRQTLPPMKADTILVQPRERVEIAFVAAPGAWMLHCHVLEHIDHGMMGWLKVAP